MTQQQDRDRSISPKCPKCGHLFHERTLEQIDTDPRWPCPECGTIYDGRSFAQRMAAADARIEEAFRAIDDETQ